MFRSRSTSDLVVLCVAFTIGFVLVFGLIGLVLIELFHPSTDTGPMLRLESDILGVLVGALVGFIGGRSDRSGRGSPQPNVEQNP